jgi:hypothetical protein
MTKHVGEIKHQVDKTNSALRRTDGRNEAGLIRVLLTQWLNNGEIILNNWKKVVFASELPECPDCGEPYCKKHKQHYGDCECIGPTEDDVEYKESKNGELYARRM